MDLPVDPHLIAEEAAVVTRPGGRADLVATVISQALSTASNAIVSVVASFALTSSDFGALTLSLIVFRLSLMATDGVVGSVLLIKVPQLAPDDAEQLSAAGRRTTVALGIVGALIAFILAITVLRNGPLVAPFLAIAAFLPALLLHETLRVQAFALRRPNVAVGGDAIWVALGGSGAIAMSILVDPVTAWQLLSVWSIGALVGAVFMTLRLRTRERSRATSVRGYLRAHRHLAGAYLADNVVAIGSGELASIAISAGLGYGKLGAWRTASIVYSPLDPLRLAVMSWAVPRATSARSTPAAVRKDFLRLGFYLGGFTLVFVVPCGLLAVKIADLSDPTSAWAGITPLIVPAAILTVTRAFAIPFGYLLRIEERSRLLVRMRLVDGLTLTAVIVLASTTTLTVVAWSYAIHRAVFAVAWMIASQRPTLAADDITYNEQAGA